MVLVGLTGGIATGKSTVARMFRRCGAVVIDADLLHLLRSWFNRGFLQLERIDWHTSAIVLEKLIRYEAVHAIQGWDDLRRRLQADRRCFAFFHPQLPDEPLIFVEVALVGEMARRDRAPLRVRHIRIDIEGLLFDPRRFVEKGDLQILDVGAIAIRQLTITEDDLRELLRGQPAGQGVTLRLREGYAEAIVQRGGFRVSARVKLVAPAGDRPLGMEVTHVRVGPLPVPDFLSNWVVRHFDPTLALKRLPVQVTVEPIRMKLGRIEVGGPALAAAR